MAGQSAAADVARPGARAVQATARSGGLPSRQRAAGAARRAEAGSDASIRRWTAVAWAIAAGIFPFPGGPGGGLRGAMGRNLARIRMPDNDTYQA